MHVGAAFFEPLRLDWSTSARIRDLVGLCRTVEDQVPVAFEEHWLEPVISVLTAVACEW